MSDEGRGFRRLENGDVQLTMREEDFDRFVVMMGIVSRAAIEVEGSPHALLMLDQVLGFINRVVSGHPHYTLYEISERERDHPYQRV